MQSEQARDVTLILKDGKEIRVSSNELSAGSDFFCTLQNTDMKERIEGIIRLEHVAENVMRDVLEFMRSGSVDITHENAKDLIEAADYFLLPSLKRAAGRLLEQTLRSSNCISIHQFAERYQCDDLVLTSREFIFSNFAAVAESQEFLHLESQQVENWICRDEISVNSEDIVFRIILKWIEQGKSERKGKFEELFRHVRLSFVSSGYLKKYVVTNNFVKENLSCLERVKDALKGIFPESEDRQQSSRNWSDSHLVIFTGKETLCYDPVKDNWYQLSDAPIPYSGDRVPDVVFLCPREDWIPGPFQWLETWQRNISRFHPFQMTAYQGKLYVMPRSSIQDRFDLYRHIHYDSSLNSWGIWPWRERRMVSLERSALTVVGQHIYSVNTNPKSISKYNASSNTWNIVSSGAETVFIDEGICAVPMGNYLYVLGGSFTRRQARRFDTLENKWEQIADMNKERINACGVAAHGKIFVAGGCMLSCEMYNISSNEWREMASLNIPRAGASMVHLNGLLYIVGGAYPFYSFAATLESYDIETNMWTPWKKETKIPISNLVCPMEGLQILKACSLNIRKDLLPKPIPHRGKGLLASLWYEMKIFFPKYTNHKQPRPRPWIGQI